MINLSIAENDPKDRVTISVFDESWSTIYVTIICDRYEIVPVNMEGTELYLYCYVGKQMVSSIEMATVKNKREWYEYHERTDY